MGACATKPGDLKVKGDAPLVVEDAAAAPPAAADEKAKAGEVPVAAAAPLAAADEKAKGGEVPVAAAEVDQADVSRRRSLSVLLKQEAEASDGEADAVAEHQETEKVVGVAEEPASAPAVAAGETTMGSPQVPPVQASVATTEHDDTAQELKEDDLPSGDAHVTEEEKQVDPESVQVAVDAVADATDAAAPSSEKSKAVDAVADATDAAAPSSEENKAADDDDASA